MRKGPSSSGRCSSARSAAGTTAARAPRSPAPTLPARLARRAVRRDRPRGILRLPDDAAAGGARERPSGRIEWPENTFHYVRLTEQQARLRAATRCCSSAPSRGCAGRPSPALVSGFATDLDTSLVVTLGSLLADVPHTRPAPVTASATDPGAPRRARTAAVALRGPDRSRRCAPRRLPARATSPRSRSGQRSPTTCQLTPSPGRRRRCVTGSPRCWRCRSTPGARRGGAAYVQQVSEAVAADEDTAADVDELESRSEEIEEGRSFRRARRSPPSSRGSCASASRNGAGAARPRSVRPIRR